MARATLAFLGTGLCWAGWPLPLPEPPWAASRATVTRGLNSSHSFAPSLGEMRTGIGFRHWNRVEGSKWAHCLQQCKATPHLGQLARQSTSEDKVVEQL